MNSVERNRVRSEFQEIWSFIKTLAIFVVAALFLRASVVEAFKIPSGSMLPTLHIGDHILVCKFSYGLRLPFRRENGWQFGAPKRGDIVVFTRPDDPATLENEDDTNIIKRVIALPGESVEVRNRVVYINARPLDEPYARWEQGGIPEGDFGPHTVPEGRVLLLGDNRDRSRDSRFWGDPFLELRRIKGRALIIYWSWDSWRRTGMVLR